jgi:hypothetical protein
MSCANLPSYASCAFTPATVSFGSANTATVVLSIATQQTTTANNKDTPFARRSPTLLALAGLFLFPLFSRRLSRKLGERSMLLLLMLSLSLLSGLTGCGGGGSGESGNQNPGPTVQNTPAGTYNVVITATSGTISHSTTVSLTVN